MAGKLLACDPGSARERPDLDEDFVPRPGKMRDPQKLLRLCPDHGLGIIAWA
jgi:hypothetical protein